MAVRRFARKVHVAYDERAEWATFPLYAFIHITDIAVAKHHEDIFVREALLLSAEMTTPGT